MTDSTSKARFREPNNCRQCTHKEGGGWVRTEIATSTKSKTNVLLMCWEGMMENGTMSSCTLRNGISGLGRDNLGSRDLRKERERDHRLLFPTCNDGIVVLCNYLALPTSMGPTSPTKLQGPEQRKLELCRSGYFFSTSLQI